MAAEHGRAETIDFMEYLPQLLGRIEKGEIDPSFVVTHHMSFDQAPEGYEMFKHKNGCIKIVLQP